MGGITGKSAWRPRRATAGCRIVAAVGLPVSTAMSATLQAMKHLAIRSTVIATAIRKSQASGKNHYEDGGLEVLAFNGLELSKPVDHFQLSILS